MQGPHFKYLTNAYVEALDLEPFWYRHIHPFWIWFEDKPIRAHGYDLAVVYNHGLYLREPDGLAWRFAGN